MTFERFCVFFPHYIPAPGFLMCIAFVPLLINKSRHLVVLSFLCPPSSPSLHLDSYPTTCTPPFHSATLFLHSNPLFLYLHCSVLKTLSILPWDQDTQQLRPLMQCPRSAPKLLRPAQARHAKPTGREHSNTGAEGKVLVISLFLSLLSWWFWLYDWDNWTHILWNDQALYPLNMNVHFDERKKAKRWADGGSRDYSWFSLAVNEG